MPIGVGEIEARISALHAAAADLVELSWDEVSVDVADAVVAGVESVQRTLSTVDYAAINRLKADGLLGRGRRLRDHLANMLHVSATEAGSRIAAAVFWAAANDWRRQINGSCCTPSTADALFRDAINRPTTARFITSSSGRRRYHRHRQTYLGSGREPICRTVGRGMAGAPTL